MIVLGRKIGETIHIGNDVVVTVVKTGKQIRLGIDAPRDVAVVRGELKKDFRGVIDKDVKNS